MARQKILKRYKSEYDLWGNDALQLDEVFYSKDFDDKLVGQCKGLIDPYKVGETASRFIDDVLRAFITERWHRDQINVLLEQNGIDPIIKICSPNFFNDLDRIVYPF